MDIQGIIASYREVLADVSREANRLEQQYEEYMLCRKGCSDCCTDISLLPLEWYALRERVRASKESFIQEGQPDSCALLKDRICSFYPSRPLICRTHGLPLLYLAEEYDRQGDRVDSEEPDWQISWCDLNFTAVTEETMEEIFDPEDLLNMEEWNMRLKALNQDFLETGEGAPFREKRRIPLQEIFKEFS